MEYIPFAALLKSEYNNIREFGQGRLAGQENAVDFTGDFVPLLPLNAPATIEWVLGDKPQARFSGSVYLSSSGLLRITGIEAGLIRGAQSVFSSNIHIPARVLAEPAHTRRNRSAAASAMDILYLSRSRATLRTSEPIAAGLRLLLSAEVDFLTLDAQPLIVRQSVPLRRGESLLLCEILPGSDANLIALSAYVSRLELIGEDSPGG